MYSVDYGMASHLTDEQRRRIADILKREPPREFLDPDFHTAYEEVQAADRELALAWLDSLGASDEEPKSKGATGPLPAEEGALRARWAAARQRAVRAATTSRVAESDSPRAFIPDSRRIVGTVLFGALALAVGVIAWTVWSDAQTPVADDGGATPAAVVESDPTTAGPPVVVIDPPAPEPTSADAAPPIAAAPVVEPPPPLTFTSETPAPITPAPVGPPGTMPAPAGVPEVEMPRATRVFAEAPATERSTVLHQAGDLGTGGIVGGSAPTPGQALVGTTPRASVVFGTPSASAASAPPTGGVVFGGSEPGAVATGGVVFAGAPTASSTNATLVHASATSTTSTANVPTGTPPLAFGSSEEAQSATPEASSVVPPLTLGDAPAAPGFALALEGSVHDDRSAPAAAEPTFSGVSANAAPATWNPATRSWSTSAAANLPAELQVGARIPARLVTSATIVAGAPAPVIAETYGQWCGRNDCASFTFIGRAELVGGNRVIMNFDQVVSDEGVFAIEAVALSEDRSTSIPALVRDETPTLAPDLVRASLGGVTQWATSLLSQTRTTVGDGGAVQETVVPPLEALIAGSLAQALQLPSSSTTVVRLAEIDPGTPVVLAVGVSY